MRVGNVGRVDDGGETSLAAATAAIITARWTAASKSSAPAPAAQNGNGQAAQHGNGQAAQHGNGHAAWARPTFDDADATGRHGGNGSHAHEWSAADGGFGRNGHHAHGSYTGDPYRDESYRDESYRDESYRDDRYRDGEHPDLPGPLGDHRGGAPHTGDVPLTHDPGGIHAAAANFFAPAQPEPVPEIFSMPPIPGQRSGLDPDDFSLGSVMGDMPFPEPPEPFEPGGFSAFGSSPGAPPAPSRPLAADEVTGTPVPPGFERRTFRSYPAQGTEPSADGPAFDGPAFDAPAFEGPAFEGPAFDAPAFEGPAFEGPAFEGPGRAVSGVVPEFGLASAEAAAAAASASPVAPMSFPPAFPGGEPFGGAGPFEKAPQPFDPLSGAAAAFDGPRDPGVLPRRPVPRGDAEPPRQGAAPSTVLPRRTPRVPDVPDIALFANDPLLDPASPPSADGSDLTRIATYLRDDEDHTVAEHRPEGFDFADVLEAVRRVRDVRDAQLRWNSGAGHTLRIEFADGADEGEVTRAVVRLLRERMGLEAAPSAGPGFASSDGTTLDRPAPRARGSAVVASAAVPVRPPATTGAGHASAGAPGGGQFAAPGDYPLPLPPSVGAGVPRVVLDHVQVTTLGTDATVEVRLVLSRGGVAVRSAIGTGQGPAVDAYLLRLAATSAGNAIDQLLAADGAVRGRCFVEHVAVVPFGVVEIAMVVLLLSHGSHTEQLAGAAIVAGDQRQAVVRATLAALNRRLQSLLS